jgi:predicted SAM-dependent methyltransferase
VRRFVRTALRRAQRGKAITRYLAEHEVRKLQLGAAENIKPGWLNTDLHGYGRGDELVYLDVRRRFPLPDASFDLVYSEHTLEHLTYAQGQQCLRECFRVLRPGGTIRTATPSLEQLARLYDGGDLQERYVRWAVETLEPEVGAPLPGVVLNNFFRSWGHRFIYDPQTLRYALTEAGFVEIEEQQLSELERHLAEAPEFNQLETFVLEARRPAR